MEEQKGHFFISTVANNEPGEGRNETNLETGAIRDFWRDPDPIFCCICGDEEQEHVELTCPYNYLHPASYAPCKARLLLWQNETTDIRCFGRPEEAPILDEVTLRRLGFLRCFVCVNNLPKQCCPEQLAGLFLQFGPLRNWYVAFDGTGTCSGFGYMIFQHRTHAEETIEMLNCYAFGDCKLRVHWAYPCA
ncbi:uncharacterized protein [Lolium perenne]|uniref:uncharacterized protein n=1 Tax=Lolium perenne TaxID=4522 RepID=UPI003A99CB03